MPPPLTPDPPTARPSHPIAFVAPSLRPDAVVVLASMALSNWAEVAR
ncbi:MAG: hypothetical protein ACREOS_01020 [Candidatus Dormibacteraceae bacterium]